MEEILEYEQELGAEHKQNEEKREEDFEIEKEYSNNEPFTRKIVDIAKDIIDALHNISVPLIEISQKLSSNNQPKPQPMKSSGTETTTTTTKTKTISSTTTAVSIDCGKVTKI